MAGLMRLNQLLQLSNRSAATTLLQTAARPAVASQIARLIGTSTKAPAAPAATASAKPADAADAKNWVSYGFDFRDKATDRSAMRASYFFSVTLCLVWGTFVWSYLPDPQMRNWAQRQGYLTLRQRELAGEEPISANYVDPASIQLPSEDELEGVEIII